MQSVLENQHNHETKLNELFKHIETKLNDRLDTSLSELKTNIIEMKIEVGVNQTYFNAKLSQLHAYLITTNSDFNIKFADVSQSLSNNTKLLEETETQCLENRYPILVYSHDRTTRLANVKYLFGFGIGGRLEVYQDGEWGTVCDDEFDNIDAAVACSEFGYANGKAHEEAYYGEGQGKVW